jgi:hypothetical protein
MQKQRRYDGVVMGPDGNPLTLDDLPPAGTTRWVIRRKAEVVAAVSLKKSSTLGVSRSRSTASLACALRASSTTARPASNRRRAAGQPICQYQGFQKPPLSPAGAFAHPQRSARTNMLNHCFTPNAAISADR